MLGILSTKRIYARTTTVQISSPNKHRNILMTRENGRGSCQADSLVCAGNQYAFDMASLLLTVVV